MNYDEDEVVLNDLGFNLNDDENLDEPLEEKDDFKFDEEEMEAI